MVVYIEERKYKVYAYTNKINGKKYIGQTRRSLKIRAGKNGSGYQKCPAFFNAIQKYGWDNFESEILYDNLTAKEANDLEVESIHFFKTLNENYGYNIEIGGNNHERPHLRIPVVQFDLKFNYINRYESLTDAFMQTGIDKSHIADACSHDFRQCGGFIWLFESDYISGNYNKEDMLYLLEKDFEHPNSRAVIQCDLDMNFIARYRNISEASRKSGARRSGINDNCTGRLKTSGGYIWMYESDYEENIKSKEKIQLNAKTTKHKKHSVVQLDLNGNFIDQFPSLLEASKNTGVDRKTIAHVCKGVYRHAGGFLWKYASDYFDTCVA